MHMLRVATSLHALLAFTSLATSRPNGLRHHDAKPSLATRSLSPRDLHSYGSRQDSRYQRGYSFDSDDSDYTDYSDSIRDSGRQEGMSPEKKASMHLAAQSALGGLGLIGFGTAAGLGIAGHFRKQKCLKAHPGPNGHCKGIFHRRDLRSAERALMPNQKRRLRQRDAPPRLSNPAQARLQRRTEGEDVYRQRPPQNGKTHEHEGTSHAGKQDSTHSPIVHNMGRKSLPHTGNGQGSGERTEYHTPDAPTHKLSGRPSSAYEGEYNGGLHQQNGGLHQQSGVPNSSPLSTIESGKSHSHHSSLSRSLSMSESSGSTRSMTSSERDQVRAIEHPKWDRMRTKMIDRWKVLRKSPLKLSLIGLGVGAAGTGVALVGVGITRKRKCQQDPNLCMDNPVHQPTMLGVPAPQRTPIPQFDSNGTWHPNFMGSPRYTSADFQQSTAGQPDGLVDTKLGMPPNQHQQGGPPPPSAIPNKAAASSGGPGPPGPPAPHGNPPATSGGPT